MSRTGYKSWITRKPSKQSIRKNEITEKIVEIHETSHQIYGAPKITAILNKKGENISIRTVSKYMKEKDIRACYIKPWVKTTINSDFSSKLKNVLKREFKVQKSNAVWVSDITYIWTYDGFVYLATIMDLFNREIIAWDISASLCASSVVKCVNIAKSKREYTEALILHMDRGIQYTCQEFYKVAQGIKLSYSEKGTPWDNAVIEAFHAIIKREWLNRFKIENIEHAKSLCFEYIEAFYNTVRIHGTCEYSSPMEYEKNMRERS